AMRALAAGASLVRAAGGLSLYRAHGDARLTVSRSFAAPEKLLSQMRVLERLERTLEDQGRLAEYAPSLGAAWHGAALMGFQNGHSDLARECRERGRRLGGREAVSRTPLGRLLVGLLGMER